MTLLASPHSWESQKTDAALRWHISGMAGRQEEGEDTKGAGLEPAHRKESM